MDVYIYLLVLRFQMSSNIVQNKAKLTQHTTSSQTYIIAEHFNAKLRLVNIVL